MLKAYRTASIAAPDAHLIVLVADEHKLALVQKDGNLDIFLLEGNTYKLAQKIPNFGHDFAEEPCVERLKELLYSPVLATVFVRCDQNIALLNSTNFEAYDNVVDRRGIGQCWLIEEELSGSSSGDKMVYLIYSTIKSHNVIRMLIWKNKTYKRMIEKELPLKNDSVISFGMHTSVDTAVLVTKKNKILAWNINSNKVSRITSMKKTNYPDDAISTVDNMLNYATGLDKRVIDTSGSNNSPSDDHTLRTRKSSFMNFWPQRQKTLQNKKMPLPSQQIIHPKGSSKPLIMNHPKKQISEVVIGDVDESLLLKDNQHFYKNSGAFAQLYSYTNCEYLILANDNFIKFVDCYYGFVFLKLRIEDGTIKYFEKTEGNSFLLWTSTGNIETYSYVVDNLNQFCEETDDYSIYENVDARENFDLLWHKIRFLKFYLWSADYESMCRLPDTAKALENSLLDFRDLNILWNLEIYERLNRLMNLYWSSIDDLRLKIDNVENVIISRVFKAFTVFHAPPKLVLLKTFPTEIFTPVLRLFGNNHSYLKINDDQSNYKPSPRLMQRYYVPYLIETRRHMKNIYTQYQSNEHDDIQIEWKYAGKKVYLQYETFLIDRQERVGIDKMLVVLDTAIFLSYLMCNSSLLGPFLRVENFCDYDIVIDELSNRKLFKELVDFYHGRSKHKEALKLLWDMRSNSNVVRYSKLNLSIDTIILNYLRKLPNEYLSVLFKYIELMIENSNRSMLDIMETVLMTDEITSSSRDHVQVYHFIEAIDDSVALRYLEYAVSSFEKARKGEAFILLLEKYLNLVTDQTIKMKLSILLKTTNNYDAERALNLVNSKLGYENSWSGDLKLFVIGLKPYILRKIQRHFEAVDILLYELSDYNKASIYCQEIYNIDVDRGRDLLRHLWSEIIKGCTSDDCLHILDFLQEHSEKLDRCHILSSIPVNVNINHLAPVIKQMLRRLYLTREQTRISKSITQVELMNSSSELTSKRSEFLVIGEEQKCMVCGKVYTDMSIDKISWYSSNNRQIVSHYACGERFLQQIKNQT